MTDMAKGLDRKKSDRLLIKLIIMAALIAAAFELGEWLQKKGILPFGFRYQIAEQGLIIKGTLNTIQKPGLQKILKEISAPRRIDFFSEIYAAQPGHIFFHVTRPECILVIVGGKTIRSGARKFFIPLVLKKGFNPITIRYAPPALNPADLHIAFSENATLLPFPFFRLVRPGNPFSLPKLVFYLIRAIDIGRALVFFLVLLLVFFRLPRFFLQPQYLEARPSISPFQLLLQLLIDIFSIYNILVFCFYILSVQISLEFLFWGSILLGLFFLLLGCKKRTVIFALPWKKAGVFFGISLVVLLGVFFTCGSFLPLEPIGYGDFNHHLEMIKTIQLQGRFLQANNRHIYPQSIHASIVSGAKILGLQPEEWVTPFLMIMLVLLFFSIYLLGDELFPGIPIYMWIISLAISNATFIFHNMFSNYSFPAIIAVSLFFFALFFQLRKSAVSASLALAAGLVIYPYFAPVFLSGTVISYFWLASPFRLRKWFQLAAGLLPSIALLGIYISIFIAQGFPAQKEGFVTAYLLNPFISLRFWNTALIFIAIAFCFSLKNAKPALGLFSAIACGFLFNYVPYALFHAVSTYYAMKNMLLLIAAGVIYTAAALFFIAREFRNKKWFFPVSLSLLMMVSTASYFQTAAKIPERIARGAPAVNRWLLRHTLSQDRILINTASEDQFEFFSLTLGAQRRLAHGAADAAVVPSEVSWLVIDKHSAARPKQSKGLQKAAAFNDFSIFRIKKTSLDQ